MESHAWQEGRRGPEKQLLGETRSGSASSLLCNAVSRFEGDGKEHQRGCIDVEDFRNKEKGRDEGKNEIMFK